MNTVLLTIGLTFVVVIVALVGFWKLGPPVYRIDEANVITLLELVLEGNASESDWAVFVGMPIHYNPKLAEVQQRCIDIAEREYIGGGRYLFTAKGLEQLREVLAGLRE